MLTLYRKPKTDTTMATSSARRGSIFLYLALLFFAIGIIVILRTAGFLPADIYARLMTWQSLTIATGIFLLCTRELVIGIITTVLGVIAMFDLFGLLGIIGTLGILLILGAVMIINYLRR